MKKWLFALATVLSIVACKKDVKSVKSVNDVQVSSVESDFDPLSFWYDAFPDNHMVDSGQPALICYQNTCGAEFGGTITSISFTFSNPNIIYKNVRLFVGNVKVATWAHAPRIGDVKKVTYTAPIGIEPGVTTFLKLLAQPNGTSGKSFNTSIQVGDVTYLNISGDPARVDGLPSVAGTLTIR